MGSILSLSLSSRGVLRYTTRYGTHGRWNQSCGSGGERPGIGLVDQETIFISIELRFEIA